MHQDLEQPWDESNETAVTFNVRTPEGEELDYVVKVSDSVLGSFESLDPVTAWTPVYSPSEAILVFSSK